MARKAFGLSSLAVIAIAAVGLMVFTFLGTATGVAGSATASAFGADLKVNTAVSSSSLVGPIPKVSADAATPTAEGSLVRIGEVPAGGALIQEIGALIVSSKVDLTAGTSRASSDTAHVGLLRTAPAGGGLPLPLPLPAPLPGGGTPYNRIDVDAIHGIVNLDCSQLASLRNASEVTRLNAITKGSQILGLSIPDLGINAKLFDTLTDNLGSTTDDHAAALRVRLDLATLGLPALPAPLNVLNGNILEVTLYEVKGTNLTTPSLTNATVGASVTMLHVRVLDRTTLGLELDLRIGHAEATLSNCTTPPTTQPPTTGGPTIIPPVTARVDVDKAVEAINGTAVLSQTGLKAERRQEVEYSLTVFNQSLPATCSINRVVDTLPEGMTFVSSAGDLGAGVYDAAANTITWDNLAIPGGAARRQGLLVRINDLTAGGTFVNQFTATGSCGTYTAVAPGIDVAPLRVEGVQIRGETPRTGVADNAWLLAGALMVAAAVGGTRVMRRG